jgi:hypothetical protein
MARRMPPKDRSNVPVQVTGGWRDHSDGGGTFNIVLQDPANGRLFAEIEIPEETAINLIRNRDRTAAPLGSIDIAPRLLDEWGYVAQLVNVQLDTSKYPKPPTRGRAAADEEARSDFDRWVKLVEPGNMSNDGWYANDSTFNGHHVVHPNGYRMAYFRFVKPGTSKVCRVFPDATVTEVDRTAR